MRFFCTGLIGSSLLLQQVSGFCPVSWRSRFQPCQAVTVAFASKNGDSSEDSSSPDFFENTPKLGIDIGKLLNPLTPEEAMALKAEATELINDAVAEGIDDIEKMRRELQEQMEVSRQAMNAASELNRQRETEKLMEKIDQLTCNFLAETELQRSTTKMADAADKAMEGKGVDLGSWGQLGGGAVVMTGSGASVLLGSVDSAKPAASDEDMDDTPAPIENRIVIIADESQDAMAKKLIPPFSKLLQDAIPSLDVQHLKPTATMPLGGLNAACVVVFTTSLTDQSTLLNMYDRLLRKTLMPNGKVGTPPTQLVCISTVGTERTNKFPYSMQNVMGGKLDKRRQMEEAVMLTVKQRATEPPLDYTILKFGELQDTVKEPFHLMPGDVLDGPTSVTTAVHVLMQAVAFQPAARNATLCAIGNMPENPTNEFWDDAFLKLDGPEILRLDQDLGDVSKHDQLVEYLGEWALMMESGKKKLATPIRVETSKHSPNPNHEGVKQRRGVRLVFLPTNTGKAYTSRHEEVAMEREMASGGTPNTPKTYRSRREGGIEVLAEVTTQNTLRVRARRCNMADDTVVKEISEETILNRLKDAIDIWKKDLNR